MQLRNKTMQMGSNNCILLTFGIYVRIMLQKLRQTYVRKLRQINFRKLRNKAMQIESNSYVVIRFGCYTRIMLQKSRQNYVRKLRYVYVRKLSIKTTQMGKEKYVIIILLAGAFKFLQISHIVLVFPLLTLNQ